MNWFCDPKINNSFIHWFRLPGKQIHQAHVLLLCVFSKDFINVTCFYVVAMQCRIWLLWNGTHFSCGLLSMVCGIRFSQPRFNVSRGDAFYLPSLFPRFLDINVIFVDVSWYFLYKNGSFFSKIIHRVTGYNFF